MAGEGDDIRKALKKLVGADRIQVMTAKVLSVDKTKCTCDLEPVNGDANILNARLRASINDLNTGVVIFPKVESFVICAMLFNKDEPWCIIGFDEVESILITVGEAFKCEVKNDGNVLFNEGVFGGLVKINELVSKINFLENRMMIHQHVSPSGLTTVDLASNSPFDITVVAELENGKIKHG